MTLQEQKEIFGKDIVIQTITEILQNYYYQMDWLEEESDQIFREYLNNNEASVDWLYKLRMDNNRLAKNKLQKIIRKWEVKLKIADDRLDEHSVLMDLDVIKRIPCQNFLPPPEIISQSTLKWKAPWRPKENDPSLCVFKKTNRFYDFGDPEKKGTVIDLIMLLEDLDLKQAINYLKNYL